MTDLIKRLKEATEPSRELDAEIAGLFGWELVEFNCSNINGSTERGGIWFGPADCAEERYGAIDDYRLRVGSGIWPGRDRLPAYTSDLNAVIALIEEKLPGAYWELALASSSGGYDARVDDSTVRAGHPAMALLLALLEAMEVQDG